MTLVWVTLIRGVMAIVLGLALALHHDRAPAALANFMGVYWILNGVVTLQWGLVAERRRPLLALIAGLLGTTLVVTSNESGSVSTWLASAWALLGGAVLVSDALRIRLTRLETGSRG